MHDALLMRMVHGSRQGLHQFGTRPGRLRGAGQFLSQTAAADLTEALRTLRFSAQQVNAPPGTPAEVDGFGAVFSNVNIADTTKTEFFDSNGGAVANLVEIAVAGISSGISLSRHAARSMH